MKFRETNDVSITTASLTDPLRLDAVIAAVKSLVRHGGNENVGIPGLLLRLGRSLAGFASAKCTLGIKPKMTILWMMRESFWNSMLKNVANIRNMH